jgi:hypothetical protein
VKQHVHAFPVVRQTSHLHSTNGVQSEQSFGSSAKKVSQPRALAQGLRHTSARARRSTRRSATRSPASGAPGLPNSGVARLSHSRTELTHILRRPTSYLGEVILTFSFHHNATSRRSLCNRPVSLSYLSNTFSLAMFSAFLLEQLKRETACSQYYRLCRNPPTLNFLRTAHPAAGIGFACSRVPSRLDKVSFKARGENQISDFPQF